MSKQKKFILQESEIPTQWYNIQADMPTKPMPPIHPATKQPLGVDDLAHIFPRECCVQELDTEHRWIDITSSIVQLHWFVPMRSRRPWEHLPISTLRTRVPTHWVHIKSTLPFLSATTPSRKAPLT